MKNKLCVQLSEQNEHLSIGYIEVYSMFFSLNQVYSYQVGHYKYNFKLVTVEKLKLWDFPCEFHVKVPNALAWTTSISFQENVLAGNETDQIQFKPNFEDESSVSVCAR